MTAAGNALHLTQSAVSQHIARLEDLSGALFLREKRTLRLTPNGERFLGKARRLVTLNDKLWADMADVPIDGLVRLGAPYDLVGTWLPPILKAFPQAHPKVDIKLVCLSSPELLTAVTDGAIDLALVEEPVGTSEGECLAADHLVWVGAMGGAAYLKTPLPVSMVAKTCAFRPVVLRALGECDLAWRTMFESGSIDATRATVRADLAVTVWLSSTVPNDLTILPFGENLPKLPLFAINLYHGKARFPRAVGELIQQIRHSVSVPLMVGQANASLNANSNGPQRGPSDC